MARLGKTKPHIKIGNYYFNLDETIDAGTSVGSLYRPHYRWSIQSYFSPTTVLAGSKENERALRTWFLSDFSGGEGDRVWFPDDPTVYDFSYGLNPRVRGQLTGRPSRTRDALAGTPSTASAYLWFGMGGGTLWAAGQADLWTLAQNDPITGAWTQQNSNLGGGIATDSTYTAVGSDPNRLLLGESITGGTTFKIRAASLSGDTTTNYATVTNGARSGMVCELASMHGFVWSLEFDLSTQIALRRYDVSNGYDYNASTNPIERLLVKSIPWDPTVYTLANFKSQTSTQSWYTGIAPTSNSVFFFISGTGFSRLWEYVNGDAAHPIWAAPDGFTIRDITFSNGYLYIIGNWGPNSTNSGFGSLYLHEKDSQDTVFIADLGRSRGINSPLTVASSAYGADVVLADGVNGRIWTYNADEDGISLLDTIATTGGDASVSGSQGGAGANTTPSFTFSTSAVNYITDMITWGGVRFVGINDSGSGTFQVLRYLNDEPSNRQAGTATGAAVSSLTTGINDFGLPFQPKFLTGFDVLWRLDPATTWSTGQSIIVEYDCDGAGFVAATTIDETHADRNKGRTFLSLATPPNFTALRLRVTLSGSSAATVKPPILLGVAAEAQSYQEVLELMVSLKNPMGNTRRGPKATSDSAWLARSYLRTLAKSGQAVTVVDGYGDPRAGQTTTYTMTVDSAEDIIVRDGEGTMRVVLRTV